MIFADLATGDSVFVDATTPVHLVASVALCQQIGLLTNDALTVALMRAHGLDKIATSDTDFDRLPGITRYAPA